MWSLKQLLLVLVLFCTMFFINFLPLLSNDVVVIEENVDLLPLLDITSMILNDSFNLHFQDVEKRVIFIETSGKAVLNARMVCTLESVTRVNPDLTLIVVFIKPATVLDLRENKALAHVLPFAPNIHLTTLDAGLILKNSIFTGIDERFNRSVAPLQHISDALRLLLVWKVGGIYMDLDMVFHKNLTHLLGKNFIYSATTLILNNCMFGFKAGHPLLLKLMKSMIVNYVPENYAAGPSTFAQTLSALSNKTEAELIKLGKVGDVLILPHYEIGPVVYMSWDYFFKEAKSEIYKPMMKHGIAFHFWNKLSWNRTVPVNSTCSYARIARNYCPLSFGSCDTDF